MLKYPEHCWNLHSSEVIFLFSDIFLSIWKNLGSENSVLAVSQIFRLFLNILTPDDKYSLLVKVRDWQINLNEIFSKAQNIFFIFVYIA